MMLKEKLISQDFIVAAHRGYRSEFPENSLLAFEKAIIHGVDMIEVDLRYSKDRQIVIIHDDTVNRVTNSEGCVSNLTLSDLKSLNLKDPAGAPSNEVIPALEEFIEFVSEYPDLFLNIEIKPQERGLELAKELLKILEPTNLLERSVITSFDFEIIHFLYSQGIFTQGFMYSHLKNVGDYENVYESMDAICIFESELDRKIVQKFENENLFVWTCCPNSKDSVKYAYDCGIRLVTVDDIIPALEFKQSLNNK